MTAGFKEATWYFRGVLVPLSMVSACLTPGGHHGPKARVQTKPHRTHTRALFLASHARTPDVIIRLAQGSTICLCASKNHSIIGHVFVECSFDPVSSCFLITCCLTDATYCLSLTPLTGIRLNPCATPLWGWTLWSSGRSDPKHSSRHMFWPLHPGAASERTSVLVPTDSVVASKVWAEHLVARTCF